MMDLLEIRSLTPDKAQEVHTKALSGDVESVKDYIYYSAWKEIENNKLIPEQEKALLYESLMRIVNIELAKVNG